LPTFGAIIDDRDRVRLGFLRATRALAYLNTGITLLLWWLAALAINLLYGSSFHGSIPFLRILCLAALLYPLGALSGSVMLALGRADLELKLTALRALATGAFAYVGWKIDGAQGIAWGVSAYAVVMSALDVLVTGWLVRARLRDLARTFTPSVVVGGGLFAALVIVEEAAHPSTALRLVITVIAAALYVAGGLWVDRDLLGAIVPSLRSRGVAPALVLEEHGNPS